MSSSALCNYTAR